MTREEEIHRASLNYNIEHGMLKVVGGDALLSEEESLYFNQNPSFIAGAKWADEHPKTLWQDATGDNLPPIDKEVIVLTSSSKGVDLGEGYAVCFAHRPNPEPMEKIFFDGHTENVYTQTYGKGGWNIPDVVWWLDCGELPKVE